MQTERICADCGLPLPAAESGAGCPHCLFRLAFGDKPPEEAEQSRTPLPTGLRSRFFGDYELLGEIGRGGMGVIYKARQLTLNRTVALKMIQTGHLSSPEAWFRFRTEIAAVAQLNHPHIVSLYESGDVGGTHFYTMRLLDGGNLAKSRAPVVSTAAIAPGAAGSSTFRQSERAAAGLMIKIARAVQYAHERGVLHRDLKPSNILLDDRGEPHVADFGLAKLMARESAATLTESILGSPNYMAPEQASAGTENVTVQADIYGLGAIFYELLTGVPPFQAGTPVDTIRKVLDEPPVPPRRINPAVDLDLQTICLKCLEKDPGERYRSAAELASDLELWLHGLPITARPVGALGAAWRWARRHPGLAAVSTLLILTLIGVAIGATVAAMRIRNAEQVAVARLRDSLLDQTRVLRLTQSPGRRTEGLRLLHQAADLGGPGEYQDRLRDNVLATVALPGIEFTPLDDVALPGPERILLDPAMERVAVIVDETNVALRAVGTGESSPVRLQLGAVGGRLEAFSADGRFLAVRHSQGIEFHDTHSGTLIFSTNARTRGFSFAKDPPIIAFEEEGCAISLRQLPSFEEIRRIQLEPDPPGSNAQGFSTISLSPDGSMLACARAVGYAVELIDVKTGQLRWRNVHENQTIAMAWQLSRGRLATATSDARARILRLNDGGVGAAFSLYSPATYLAVHDTSGLLATACQDRRVRLWDLPSLRFVSETECEARNLAFDAGGTRLSTAIRGDKAGWLDLERSSEFTELVVANTVRNVEECAFTSTGEMIAIGYPTRIALINTRKQGSRGGVNVGTIPVVSMDPRGEFILTSDGTGVTRSSLPVGSSDKLDNSQAQLVIPASRWRALAWSTNGDRVWAANAASNTVFAFARDFETVSQTIGPHEFVDSVAISPDEQWLATGSSLTLDVKVWNVKSGATVFSVHAGRNHRVTFSKDGRWLLIHGDVFDLRKVGSWERAPSLPFPDGQPTLGPGAFSPDGSVLAIVENQNDVRLFNLTTWKTLGLLRPPVAASVNCLAISPDGTQVAAACSRGRLRLWDLRQIANRLAEFKLDQPWLPYQVSTQ